MPNKTVVELMHQMVDLKVAVATVKTDLDGIKKLVYAAVGAGFTAVAGIIVQLVVSMAK